MEPSKPSVLESQLQLITVIQKLKQVRGISYVRRLAHAVEQLRMAKGETMLNQINEIYLLFLLSGQLLLQKKTNNQTQSETLIAHCYFFADKNLAKVEAKQDSCVCLLREKYIMQIFQGVIHIPFINSRVNILQCALPFTHLQKKAILKIAQELEYLSLKIGATVKLTQNQSSCIKRYTYYIISGQIKIIREGRAICILGPTEIFTHGGTVAEHNQSAEDRGMGNLIGKIITEKAELFKIPVDALNVSRLEKMSYMSNRSKLREARLKKMAGMEESVKQQQKNQAKSGIFQIHIIKIIIN